MLYKEDINMIKKALIERKADLIEELHTLPEGELYCTNSDGCWRYYQRLPAIGNRKKEHRYGIKRNPKLTADLVRKEYVKKALSIIDRNISAIDLVLKNYIPFDENSVMEDFLKKYPELSSGIYREVDLDEWKNMFPRIDDYHPENLKQIAADGTRMRSKNEVYIASRLDHYGIVYRTDCPTGIPGLKRAPDFTILRKRDSKIMYWEHLGMMDDPEYRRANKIKLAEYEEFGIVPWDNLILTYDTAQGGLRANLIEATIKGWLL